MSSIDDPHTTHVMMKVYLTIMPSVFVPYFQATYYEEEYDDSYYDYEDYDEDYYEDYEDYYEDYDEYDEYEDYDDYDDYDGEDDENNLTTILEQEEKLIRMLSGRSTAQSYNSGFESTYTHNLTCVAEDCSSHYIYTSIYRI